MRKRKRAKKSDDTYPVVALLTSGGGDVRGVWEEDWPNPESSEAGVAREIKKETKMDHFRS